MKTANLKPIVADKNLIAYCGLYCGACLSYLKGRQSNAHKGKRHEAIPHFDTFSASNLVLSFIHLFMFL